MRFILGTQRLMPGNGKAEIARVNGRTAILLRLANGTVFLVINLETDETQIRAFHIVGNPDKLGFVNNRG
jgi:hypothetical protein